MTLGEQTERALLGRVLAAGLERHGTVQLAVEFERLLPGQTVSLRELAAWATPCLLDALPDDSLE